VNLTHSLAQIRRTLDGSQPIDTRGAVMAIDYLISHVNRAHEGVREMNEAAQKMRADALAGAEGREMHDFIDAKATHHEKAGECEGLCAAARLFWYLPNSELTDAKRSVE